ncbi:hypothetical protein [Bradyrhizobium sp. STM 3809]|uniref:hypothetical protein n=1 Tax=Bradyrhizobium sp. STM 3809 TaxID=551936 RepID=UPI0002406546|nr:hypothetical protein [Bradyrhizobium sp. STM 3809]CCD97626.1 hypothetical protein BRAS3809_1160008 [Bradyrhizobium sp. STM 3809]
MSNAIEVKADAAIDAAMTAAACSPSINDLAELAWLEVHRILGSQRARLLAGLIDQPDTSEITRAAGLMAVVRFLELSADARAKNDVCWLRQRRLADRPCGQRLAP